MTIASSLVTSAYRQDNLIPVDQSPSTAEAAEGLAKLNRILDNLFGYELGELLMEWPVPPPQRTASVGARYPLSPTTANDLPSTVWPYPPGNVRLMCSITSVTTIYLQHFPNDGARMELANVGMTATLTLDGNGRKIEAAATLAVTSAATTKRWFYRSDTGNWVLVATLTDSDTPYLPTEFDEYLIAELAIKLAPGHGKSPSAYTLESRNRELSKLKARYYQPTAVLGNGLDSPMTAQTYGSMFDTLNPFV